MPFTIEIEFSDVISLASTRFRNPIVQRLSLRSSGETDAVEVAVRLESFGLDMAEPWRREVRALGPIEKSWDAIELRLDVNALSLLTDKQPASLIVEVTRDGELLEQKKFDATLLPANAWVWEAPIDNYALMLAAFVMPNHPALQPILDDATRRLAADGGGSARYGYQQGSIGADRLVKAIYESVRALGITYTTPPPGWALKDTAGQRIRNPGEILGDRIGTCLDTAVLMASLLENVGIRPVLVVVPEHAFVGYWRSDEETDAFASPVVPVGDGINFLDENRLVLFETTTVCGGPDSTPFEQAIDSGRQKLTSTGALEKRGAAQSRFIDIVAARQRYGISALTARFVRPDGTIELVEYKPQEFTVNLLQAALAAEGGGTRAGLRADTPQRVRKWKNSLLDLSLRNQLIKERKRSALNIGIVVPRGTLGTIEDLLQTDHEVGLLPSILSDKSGSPVQLDARGGVDSEFNPQFETLLTTKRAVTTTLDDDAFVARLRRVAATAKALIEDTGTNNLYLAMGTLVWTPEGKEEVRSPLILIPVTLKSYNRSKQFSLVIDDTTAVTPNYSLAEKLLQDLDFTLPKLIEPDMDDAGVDIDGLLAYVRDEIGKAKLQGFRVDESCTLGFFDFSTYRLWRDLADNWETFLAAPLVNHLVYTPQLEFEDAAAANQEATGSELDDLAALLPISTDGSQVTAVSKAMAGKTFVLQGPPGTGKSQTITNLLARALHSGKRVLFIAEKPPALDVVKDRLEAVGLAPFILNLHSKSLRPAAVRQQLLAVLDAAITADKDGYEASLADLHRALPPLQGYPQRIHARGKYNESAYSARNKLLAQGAVESLPVPGTFLTNFDLETKNEISGMLREIALTGPTAGAAGENPWSLSLLHPADLTPENVDAVTGLATSLAKAHAAAVPTAVGQAFLNGIESLDEVAYVAGLANPGRPELSVIDSAAAPAEASIRRQFAAELERLESSPYPASVGPLAFAAPVAELTAAMATARHSFFIGRRKKVEAVCRQLEAYTVSGTVVTRDEFDAVLASIAAAQSEAVATAAIAQALIGLSVAANWNVLDPQQRAAVKTQVQWVDYWVALLGPVETPARHRARAAVGGSEADVAALAAVGTATRDLLAAIRSSEETVDLWMAGRTAAEAFARSVDLWNRDATERGLTRLRRWSTLLELLAPLERTGLQDARGAILDGRIPFADAEAGFERGFLTAVFGRQLDDEGLDSFDGATHDRSIHSFSRASHLTRDALPGILGTDLVASRGFDSTVTIGAVGELKRELSRTRGGKSIRKLLIDHWNVISRLTPCVLASPDSVVRFIDAGLEPFDLVVFDEASQIRVPHAIGALGRARAAVIVGDSKQMPPTSIAEVAANTDDEPDDEDETIVVDEESILSESVQARVPDVMLAWHYRSEDESLIAFSNQQYYDGRLSTFPAATETLADKGLSFVRVQGYFNRGAMPRDRFRTNIQEADAIVAEIVRRLHDPAASHSILVVTFNNQQQGLITQLLTDLGDDLVDAAMQSETSESLLIRNLEDVQGQERDIVLFSVAFSKNDGPTLPLTFGPLNRAGGERRLNVAVTRARRQVIVYCSFEPSDLRVEGTSSVGIRHLRTYLELAKFGPESSGAVSSQIVRPPDRHRDEIMAALRDAGLVCEPDVGLSDFKVDIAILDPDDETRRLVGILLDGTTWNSRATVGDRDNLPAEMLVSKMRWPAIERIWMPTWVRDRQGEIERILAAVAEVRARPVVAPVAPVIAPKVAAPLAAGPAPRATAPAQSAAFYPGVEVWKPWQVRRIGNASYLDSLRSSQVVQGIDALAREVVAVEGPISPQRFVRVVGLAHDLQRIVARRAEEILAVKTSLYRDQDGFFFLADAGPADLITWKKSEPGAGRDIADISLTELSNAIRDIARIGLGVSRDDLVGLTVRAFGTTRVTTGIRARVDAAITYGIGRGILAERAGHIEVV